MFVGKLGTKEKKHFCCVVFLALRGIKTYIHLSSKIASERL